MKSIVSFLAAVVAACCAQQPPGVSADERAESVHEAAAEEVALNAADGVQLFGDLYLGPEGRAGPLILAFHQGGGDSRGEYGPLVPRLLQHGFSVLAIDQRSGGDRFGMRNRTVDALTDEASMCSAYADLEAALRFAKSEGFTGPRIAWGSSYSAAHVVRLAAEYSEDIDGVLAFSPASGGPMAECPPTPYIALVTQPLLMLRPSSEMERASSKTQMDAFRDSGHQTFVSDPGTHGSSMLNANRVDGPVEPTWSVVLDFLEHVVDRAG